MERDEELVKGFEDCFVYVRSFKSWFNCLEIVDGLKSYMRIFFDFQSYWIN